MRLKNIIIGAVVGLAVSLGAIAPAQASSQSDAANSINVYRNQAGKPSLATSSTLNKQAQSEASAMASSGKLSLPSLPPSITAKYSNTHQSAGTSTSGALDDGVSALTSSDGGNIRRTGVDSLGTGVARSSSGKIYVVAITAKLRISSTAAAPPAVGNTSSGSTGSASTGTGNASSTGTTASQKAAQAKAHAAAQKKLQDAQKAAQKAQNEAKAAAEAKEKAEKAAAKKLADEKKAAAEKAKKTEAAEAKKRRDAIKAEQEAAQKREATQAAAAKKVADEEAAKHQAELNAATSRTARIQQRIISITRVGGLAVLGLAVLVLGFAGFQRLRVRALKPLPPANLSELLGEDDTLEDGGEGKGTFGRKRDADAIQREVEQAIERMEHHIIVLRELDEKM